jgi:hypothetical protein
LNFPGSNFREDLPFGERTVTPSLRIFKNIPGLQGNRLLRENHKYKSTLFALDFHPFFPKFFRWKLINLLAGGASDTHMVYCKPLPHPETTTLNTGTNTSGSFLPPGSREAEGRLIRGGDSAKGGKTTEGLAGSFLAIFFVLC